jgi:hypothetical protein
MCEAPKTYLLSSSSRSYLPSFIVGTTPDAAEGEDTIAQKPDGTEDDDGDTTPTVVGSDTDDR